MHFWVWVLVYTHTHIYVSFTIYFNFMFFIIFNLCYFAYLLFCIIVIFLLVMQCLALYLLMWSTIYYLDIIIFIFLHTKTHFYFALHILTLWPKLLHTHVSLHLYFYHYLMFSHIVPSPHLHHFYHGCVILHWQSLCALCVATTLCFICFYWLLQYRIFSHFYCFVTQVTSPLRIIFHCVQSIIFI